MIKTLKLKAVLENIPRQKEYSAAFRFAYERVKEGKENKEIKELLKLKWPSLGCWLGGMAILDARNQWETNTKKHKMIWGGRKNFKKLCQGKIIKEVWDKLRLRPMVIQGEFSKKSNRLFDFSQIQNNILIYKPNRKTKILITFKIGWNQKKEIEYLSKNIGAIPIQVTLKENQICFTYEQEKFELKVIPNRIMGIDMNPNYIGITIIDENKLIKAKLFKWSDKARKDDNKRNHETSMIAHNIIDMARHYQCETLALEELTMGASNAKKGKNFNRLCNNEWNRTQFQWLIKKLSDKFGMKCISVNAAYSSTIGNILHRDLPDACGAAKEIARRAPYKFIKKLCLYPETNFSILPLLNQWKEEGVADLTGVISWMDLHNQIKNLKLKYRVPLSNFTYAVSDFASMQSGITTFNNFELYNGGVS